MEGVEYFIEGRLSLGVCLLGEVSDDFGESQGVVFGFETTHDPGQVDFLHHLWGIFSCMGELLVDRLEVLLNFHLFDHEL